MSDALIDSLNRRVSELTNENASLKAEAKGRRVKGRELTGELETLRAQLAEATKELDRYKATTNDTAAKIKELETKLRATEVEKKFSGFTSELAPGVTLDKLFRVGGFDPSADGADAIDPAEWLANVKSTDAYLFKPAGETPAVAAGAAKRPALSVETPAGRGAHDASARRVTYTRADVARPDWQQTRPELVEALKRGTAEFVE